MAQGSRFMRTRPTTLPPSSHPKFYETNGLERSLATNVADYPTTINVNSLRMERVENGLCPGYVEGVGSYDPRVLSGNWAEERCDKAYKPSALKVAKMGIPSMWKTEYMRQTEAQADKVLPEPGSNSLNMYTHPKSKMYTGVIDASLASNKETIKLGIEPGQGLEYGDPRSVSRPAGNYLNYQAGKQYLVSTFGGMELSLAPFQTTSRGAYTHPATRPIHTETGRCDADGPEFQLRAPSRDSISKMLCTIKSEEFACERSDSEYVSQHVLGFPVPGKQKVRRVAAPPHRM
jgi:hypothetical protein